MMEDILIRDTKYKSGSELELQSVKDTIKISPCTIGEISEKTDMTREKVTECLKILASQKILQRHKSRYSLLD